MSTDGTVSTQTRGRCWKFGDNIPTDHLAPPHVIFKGLDVIAKHVLAVHNPEFPLRVQPGDVIVAGLHFGQSSGRAIAPKAVKATRVGCVVAESFSRTFYRNCFEVGLPILECPGITAGVSDGDLLSVDVASGVIVNETTGRTFQAEPAAPFLLDMLRAGGLIPMAARLADEE